MSVLIVSSSKWTLYYIEIGDLENCLILYFANVWTLNSPSPILWSSKSKLWEIMGCQSRIYRRPHGVGNIGTCIYLVFHIIKERNWALEILWGLTLPPYAVPVLVSHFQQKSRNFAARMDWHWYFQRLVLHVFICLQLFRYGAKFRGL